MQSATLPEPSASSVDSTTESSSPESRLATFVSVVDGDTVETSAGVVRLIGIDSPERGECGHDEAMSAVSDLLSAGDQVDPVGEVFDVAGQRSRFRDGQQLPEQGADLELLAHSLQLSARTLQRRLREAGLSFSELLDETRQQLVLHYLRDPALELAEIAFLVGFSEAGSLARAFRRWTGQSPGAYRQSLLDSASQS